MRVVVSIVTIALGAIGINDRVGHRATPTRFVLVSAGADHACALTDHGEAYCWGSNQFGQLGVGTTDTSAHASPVRVSTDLRFTALAAGFTHTCGLVADGVPYCWGANESGQLGDGTLTLRPMPVRVKTDIRLKQIAPGGTHTCGVTETSVGYCWGGNWHGQIGNGSRSGDTPCCVLTPVPIQTTLRFRSVVAGGIHTCGVTAEGAAYCWGSPQQGRLGTGAEDAKNKSVDKTTPTAVLGGVAFASIAPRGWHTCGLSTIHLAYCWGGGGHGVLGTGDPEQPDRPTPIRVATTMEFSAVAPGHLHTCALTRDGVAYCWGANIDGELGNGSTRDAPTPQRVDTNRRFASISAGGNVFVTGRGSVITWGFTCVVASDDGTVLCWGDNRHGELGNGSTDKSLIPKPVALSADASR